MTVDQRIKMAIERYRRMKPASGQRAFAWDEEQHPRGQPENAGEFRRKDSADASKPSDKSDAVEQAIADYKANGTKAKSFKAWFGDWENDAANASKVVDHNGEPQETHGIPIKVLHGTPQHFDAFKKGAAKSNGKAAGSGFYFAEDQRIARAWKTNFNYPEKDGHIIEAYLSIKNPFDFDAIVNKADIESIARAGQELFGDTFDADSFLQQAYVRADMPNFRNYRLWCMAGDWCLDGDDNNSVNDILERIGYDGVRHTSSTPMGDVFNPTWGDDVDKKSLYGTVWVAFNANQIKAVDNRGTFDASDDRMKYSNGRWYSGHTMDTAEIDRLASVANPPQSVEQAEAGNYRKGHVTIHGLNISIENPKGSIRKGWNKDGKTKWERVMSHHYGYIRRHVSAADGDNVDCFIGPNPEHPIVYIIDQYNPWSGRFDEHKVMIGFKGKEDAKEAYLANYPKGWQGLHGIKAMHASDFKDWLEHGDTSKPVCDTPDRYAAEHWVTKNGVHLHIDGEGKVEKPKADKVPDAPSWFHGAAKHSSYTSTKSIGSTPPSKKKPGQKQVAHTPPTPEQKADFTQRLHAALETKQPVVATNPVANTASVPTPAPVPAKKTHQFTPEENEKQEQQFAARKAYEAALAAQKAETEKVWSLKDKLDADASARHDSPVRREINTSTKQLNEGKNASGEYLGESQVSELKDKIRAAILKTIGVDTNIAGSGQRIAEFEARLKRGIGNYSKRATQEAEMDRYGKKKPIGAGQMSLFGDDDPPDAHWITIHSKEQGGKGVHVQVDGKGEILKGPKALEEKGITNLADFHKVHDAVREPAPAKPPEKLAPPKEAPAADPARMTPAERKVVWLKAGKSDSDASWMSKMSPSYYEPQELAEFLDAAGKPDHDPVSDTVETDKPDTETDKVAKNDATPESKPLFVDFERQTDSKQTKTDEPIDVVDLTTEDPDVRLSHVLAAKLGTGGRIDKTDLFNAANEIHGGTRAEGKYGQSQAYDSLEAAVNQSIAGTTDPTVDLDGAVEQAQRLDQIVKQLPTQTNRDGTKDSMQQFSTPPHYAYACAWLANLNPADKVLEPSAGTGCLTVHAQNAGADVYANELDERRAKLLADQLGEDHVFVSNAEQIAGILPKQGVDDFDVVIMNPPFSATAGRTSDKDILGGAKHIEEAGLLLKDGGRLVSIVGGGMDVNAARYRGWFEHMADEGYDLRANVLVDGDVYKKYGTTFDSRVLVFDKRPPEGDPVLGSVKSIDELMAKLEGVRNDRQRTEEPSPKQAVPEDAAEAGRSGESDDSADAASGAGLGGETGAGRQGLPDGLEDTSLRTPDATVELGGGVDDDRLGSPGAGPAGEPGTSGPVADGRPDGSAPGAKGRKRRGSGGAAGGKPVRQPDAVAPQLRPAELVTLESLPDRPADEPPKTDQHAANELSDSLYDLYKPQARVKGAKAHPSAMVESAAMAAVKPPVATYRPKLSPDVIEKGMLSDAALESVIYAGQAHEQMLDAAPDKPAMRRGYMIGDGTGAGKGRQIAGIITDNFNNNRRKAVWISKSQGLLEDAHRDWTDVGNDYTTRMVNGEEKRYGKDLFHFDKIRKGANVPEDGVCFITYDTLRGESTKEGAKTNVDILVDWLGPDFDGVIALDESHLCGNAITRKGKRGDTKPSKRALAAMELQQRLPNARVCYSSATGATEVSNLAYAERLGIWGKGTAFADKNAFIEQMNAGGVAAMEEVAQSLKATGSYCARSLAMDDGTPTGKVTYDRLTHHLDSDQREMYDALADGWQNVLENIETALRHTGGSRGSAQSQFWGAQQRFFNQVMTSMQTDAVIAAMEDDLAGITRNPDGSITHGEPRSPVIQLVNTMESATERARKNKDDDTDDADLDISPRMVLQQYLAESFPVNRYEDREDANGNKVKVPVLTEARDDDGKVKLDSTGKPIMIPVEDPRAVALRDELLDKVGSLRIPEPPIDKIINHFGHKMVAEITGRKQRRIRMNENDEPAFHKREPKSANQAESDAFKNADKHILIFSGAGNTGYSYHAGRKFKNQDRRTHYLLQPGWRADEAVQGFGRTHRTNQSSAPHYRLVEIDELKGQKRFVSTIARRLDQLGALTKGQRQTGGGDLFKASDNLESTEAKRALEQFFDDLERGAVEGLSHTEVMQQLGMSQRAESARDRGERMKPPDMGQFLNRMLSMRVDMQGKVFDAFDHHLKQTVERAIEEGTLDTGVETFKAQSIERQSDKVVYREPKSGAEARHIIAKCRQKTDRTSFADIQKRKTAPMKFVRNKQSGSVWAVYPGLDSTDPRTNHVTQTYVLHGPNGKSYRTRTDVDGYGYNTYYSKFNDLDEAEAKRLWDEQHSKLPEYTEKEEHFMSGALLPIWNRIPASHPKIYRMKMEDGQTVVGLHIHPNDVSTMLSNLHVDTEEEKHTPARVHAKLVAGKHRARLANNWKLKPVLIQGERRIELIGPSSLSEVRDIESDGVQKVRVGGFSNRYFIPTSPEVGAQVLERLTKSRPIVDVLELDDRSDEAKRYSRSMSEAVSTPEFRLTLKSKLLDAVDRYALNQFKLPPELVHRSEVNEPPELDIQARIDRAMLYAKHKPAAGQKDLFGDASDNDARWVTLHGSDGSGGTHVQIDGKGNILAGPKALAERGIKNLADFKKQEAAESPVAQPSKEDASDTLVRIEREAKSIAEMQSLLKQRAMIYQVDDKERLAEKHGRPFDAYYDLPFEEWMAIKMADQKPQAQPEQLDRQASQRPPAANPQIPSDKGSVYEMTFRGQKRFAVRDGDHPQGMGDPFFSTREEADKEAALIKSREARKTETAARLEAEKSTAETKKREHNDIDGFASDKTPVQQARIISTLNQKVNVRGKVMTRKERIRDAMNRGAVVDTDASGQTQVTLKDGRIERADGTWQENVEYQLAGTKTEMEYAKYLFDKKSGGVQSQPKQAYSKSDSPGQRDLFTGEERRQSKVQGTLKWITLHDRNGEGTTHVQVGEDGTIHAGPAALTGRKIGELSKKADKQDDPKLKFRDREPQKNAAGRHVGYAMISVDDLHVDPQRFQYKIQGINPETGTNSELKEVQEYDPVLGGQLLVWEDDDGKTYVVNGHHRAEVAKRSPRSDQLGGFNGDMPVYYVNAKDHIEARSIGALANIAEGRGTATDAARLMRDMGYTVEDMRAAHISVKGEVASKAVELSKLSPHLFQQLSNGKMSESRAAIIGKHLPDHDAQDQLFGWLSKREKPNRPFSDSKLSELARATAAQKPVKKNAGGGMFDDWYNDYPIEQRADIADYVRRNLSSERSILKQASSAKRKEKLESVGDNRLDTEGNRVLAAAAEGRAEEFDHRANASGHPIAQVLDEFAQRLFDEPKQKDAIFKEALQRVRELTDGDGSRATDTTAEAGGASGVPQLAEDGSSQERSVRGGVTSKFSKIDDVFQRIENARRRYSSR